MSRGLLWKISWIFVLGIVAMFYLIDYLTWRAEEGMSLLDEPHRQQLERWGAQAEAYYNAGKIDELTHWLATLEQQEETQTAVVTYTTRQLVKAKLDAEAYTGFNLGRSIEWKVHLYFTENPVIEIPFTQGNISFLVVLPERMRPGAHWLTARLALQVVLPMLLLGVLALLLYRHIMQPLYALQKATREFSLGNFAVRAGSLLAPRNDELSALANTFDQMATRIGDQITTQRQLIADLSHELRTPLARLDIALDCAKSGIPDAAVIHRALRESSKIRCLVEDVLVLAWLENERPQLKQEDIDFVDLIDVIIDDANFEYPNHIIMAELPNAAPLMNSNHRAVGQAIENVIRNALRHSPVNLPILVRLEQHKTDYVLVVQDSGPGVPEALLETIFKPFFRVEPSRLIQPNARASYTATDVKASAAHTTAGGINSTGCGLGLALARRQLHAVSGSIVASNRSCGGLEITITLPVQ